MPAILGATRLRGGQGLLLGTMLGALLLVRLDNGTVLMNVSGFWQRVIVGAVFLVAMLVDLLRPYRGCCLACRRGVSQRNHFTWPLGMLPRAASPQRWAGMAGWLRPTPRARI